MFRISKKLSQLCRHDRRVFRQENGFVASTDILNAYRWPEYSGLNVTRNDLDCVIRGGGGNNKLRFEWRTLDNGADAIRTSKGHSRNAGVTSDYLPVVNSPGLLAHGASLSNAEIICKEGLNRGDRLHIHFGRIINGRPLGIRPGSEVVIMIDGNA